MTHRDGVDTAATFTAYGAAAERAGPDAAALASSVWHRLDSDRWTLEWQLALWLGKGFGLDAALAQRLVTSNVLGLASLRVADDLADGELEPGDAPAARRLAAALYDEALAPYRERFPDGHRFWALLETWMADWRQATEAAASPRDTTPTPRDGAALSQDLAARGAPLRVPAAAVCLLTGHEREFATVERSLDHALRALVLYDHACDWREDLAAGRWNAFAGGERDPRRVEARLLAGEIVGPYFARIARQLDRSIALALEVGLAGLAAHLSSRRASIVVEGRSLASRYRALGDAATELFFGQYAT